MSQHKPQSMCTQEWSPLRTLQSIQEPCVLDLEGSLPFLAANSSVSTLLDGRAKLSFFPRVILSSAGTEHHLSPSPSSGLSAHPVIRASRPQVNCLPAWWMTASVRSPGLCQHLCSSRLKNAETPYPYLSRTLTSQGNCIFPCGALFGGCTGRDLICTE